jgi:hypothetical protein
MKVHNISKFMATTHISNFMPSTQHIQVHANYPHIQVPPKFTYPSSCQQNSHIQVHAKSHMSLKNLYTQHLMVFWLEPHKKPRRPFWSLEARKVPTISFWSVVRAIPSSRSHKAACGSDVGGGGEGGGVVRASLKTNKVLLMSYDAYPVRVFEFFGFTPLLTGALPRRRLIPELDEALSPLRDGSGGIYKGDDKVSESYANTSLGAA